MAENMISVICFVSGILITVASAMIFYQYRKSFITNGRIWAFSLLFAFLGYIGTAAVGIIFFICYSLPIGRCLYAY